MGSGRNRLRHIPALGDLIKGQFPNLKNVPNEVLCERILGKSSGALSPMRRIFNRSVVALLNDPAGADAQTHIDNAARHAYFIEDSILLLDFVRSMIKKAEDAGPEESTIPLSAAKALVSLYIHINPEYREDVFGTAKTWLNTADINRRHTCPKTRRGILDLIKSSEADFDNPDPRVAAALELTDFSRKELEEIHAASPSMETMYRVEEKASEMDEAGWRRMISEFEASLSRIVSTGEVVDQQLLTEDEQEPTLIMSREWADSFIDQMANKPDSKKGDRLLRTLLNEAIGIHYSNRRIDYAASLLAKAIGKANRRGRYSIILTLGALASKTHNSDILDRISKYIRPAVLAHKKDFIDLLENVRSHELFAALYPMTIDVIGAQMDDIMAVRQKRYPARRPADTYSFCVKIPEKNSMLLLAQEEGDSFYAQLLGDNAIEIITEDEALVEESLQYMRQKLGPSCTYYCDQQNPTRSRIFLYRPFEEDAKFNRFASLPALKREAVAKKYSDFFMEFPHLPLTNIEEIRQIIDRFSSKVIEMDMQDFLQSLEARADSHEVDLLLSRLIDQTFSGWADAQDALDAFNFLENAMQATNTAARNKVACAVVDLCLRAPQEVRDELFEKAYSLIGEKISERESLFRFASLNRGEEAFTALAHILELHLSEHERDILPTLWLRRTYEDSITFFEQNPALEGSETNLEQALGIATSQAMHGVQLYFDLTPRMIEAANKAGNEEQVKSASAKVARAILDIAQELEGGRREEFCNFCSISLPPSSSQAIRQMFRILLNSEAVHKHDADLLAFDILRLDMPKLKLLGRAKSEAVQEAAQERMKRILEGKRESEEAAKKPKPGIIGGSAATSREFEYALDSGRAQGEEFNSALEAFLHQAQESGIAINDGFHTMEHILFAAGEARISSHRSPFRSALLRLEQAYQELDGPTKLRLLMHDIRVKPQSGIITPVETPIQEQPDLQLECDNLEQELHSLAVEPVQEPGQEALDKGPAEADVPQPTEQFEDGETPIVDMTSHKLRAFSDAIASFGNDPASPETAEALESLINEMSDASAEAWFWIPGAIDDLLSRLSGFEGEDRIKAELVFADTLIGLCSGSEPSIRGSVIGHVRTVLDRDECKPLHGRLIQVLHHHQAESAEDVKSNVALQLIQPNLKELKGLMESAKSAHVRLIAQTEYDRIWGQSFPSLMAGRMAPEKKAEQLAELGKRMLDDFTQTRVESTIGILSNSLIGADARTKEQILLAIGDMYVSIPQKYAQYFDSMFTPVLDSLSDIWLYTLITTKDESRFQSLFSLIGERMDEKSVERIMSRRNIRAEAEQKKAEEGQMTFVGQIGGAPDNFALDSTRKAFEQAAGDSGGNGFDAAYSRYLEEERSQQETARMIILTKNEENLMNYVLGQLSFKGDQASGIEAMKALDPGVREFLFCRLESSQIRNVEWKGKVEAVQKASANLRKKLKLREPSAEERRNAVLLHLNLLSASQRMIVRMMAGESGSDKVSLPMISIAEEKVATFRKNGITEFLYHSQPLTQLARLIKSYRTSENYQPSPDEIEMAGSILGRAIENRADFDEVITGLMLKSSECRYLFDNLGKTGISQGILAMREFAGSAKEAYDLFSFLGHDIPAVSGFEEREGDILRAPRNPKAMADDGFSLHQNYCNGEFAKFSAVFDGVSGNRDPASASAIAKDLIELGICSGIIDNANDALVFFHIIDIVLAQMNFNNGISNLSAGMGTTATLAIERNGWVEIVSVGDSRCRVFRNGVPVAGSYDQTILGHALKVALSYLKRGNQQQAEDSLCAIIEADPKEIIQFIYSSRPSLIGLYEHVIWNYDLRVPNELQSWLGGKFRFIEMQAFELEKGDVIVLCTDGVSDVLCEHKVGAAARSGELGRAFKILLKNADGRRSTRPERDGCGCMKRGKHDDKELVFSIYEGGAGDNTG